MEVILQQDFPALGYVGDKVKVKPGYARNFLIPRGIALSAYSKNSRMLNHNLSTIQAKRIKLKSTASELALKISEVTLEFFLRIGTAGKAFGSVTVRDIEEAIKKEGFAIDRKQIKLSEPLKKPGDHEVGIKLHAEIVAPLKVKVNTEIPEKKEDIKDIKSKGRQKRGAKKEGRSDSEKESLSKEASKEETKEVPERKPKAKAKKSKV